MCDALVQSRWNTKRLETIECGLDPEAVNTVAHAKIALELTSDLGSGSSRHVRGSPSSPLISVSCTEKILVSVLAQLRVFAGRVSLTGDWNLPWTGEVQSFGSGGRRPSRGENPKCSTTVYSPSVMSQPLHSGWEGGGGGGGSFFCVCVEMIGRSERRKLVLVVWWVGGWVCVCACVVVRRGEKERERRGEERRKGVVVVKCLVDG